MHDLLFKCLRGKTVSVCLTISVKLAKGATIFVNYQMWVNFKLIPTKGQVVRYLMTSEYKAIMTSFFNYDFQVINILFYFCILFYLIFCIFLYVVLFNILSIILFNIFFTNDKDY